MYASHTLGLKNNGVPVTVLAAKVKAFSVSNLLLTPKSVIFIYPFLSKRFSVFMSLWYIPFLSFKKLKPSMVCVK